MANIPITDNTTLLQSLKNKANSLPNKGSSGGTDVSGVTATAGDVLSGKVIVNSSGQEVTGTMPNNGAVSQTVTANGDVSIAEGYHNGSGKITVNVEGGASMPTDGDAASGDVLSGKTFYSGGSKKTGTMKTVLFTNTIDVNKPDRENPQITFEELLGKVGKKEEDIEKIYHGLDHWCRCGCGGNYFYRDNKGFKRAINAMKKDDFVTINVEKDP